MMMTASTYSPCLLPISFCTVCSELSLAIYACAPECRQSRHTYRSSSVTARLSAVFHITGPLDHDMFATRG